MSLNPPFSRLQRWRTSAGLAAILVAAAVSISAQDATPLSVGVPIEREIGEKQSHTYRLVVTAGDFVGITVEQKGADVSATLIRPDGRTLLTVDSSREVFRTETIVAIADASGAHTIELRTGRTRGRYIIHLDDLRVAVPADETRIAAERAFERGSALYVTGQSSAYRQALGEFQTARDGYREVGDRRGEMKAAIELAGMQRFLSMPDTVASARQAEELTRLIGDDAALARAMRVLGLAHSDAGDRTAALRALEESVRISRALGDRLGEAVDLNNLGIIYGQTGNAEQAVSTFERSLQLTREGSSTLGAMVTLNNLGIAYKDLGQYDKSFAAYEQALARVRPGDRDSEALVLNNMGNTQRLLGNPDQALVFHTRALAASRASESKPNEARSLNTIGLTYYALGDYTKALDHHREALAIRRQLTDRAAEAASLDGVGRALHRLGDERGALDALREALAMRQAIREHYGETDTLQHLAQVERDRGQLGEALKHIEAAVDLDEALRERITSPELRSSYVAAEQGKYALFIDVLQGLHRAAPTRGHDAAALKISERARARVLLESLVDARVDLRQGIEPALLERERRLQRELNDASTQLSRSLARPPGKDQVKTTAETVDRLAADYQRLRAQIRQQSPRYAAVTQPQPLDAAAIQQSVVDDQSVLLEFALGEDKSWLWAVTPGSLTSVELPARREIEKSARSFYQALTARQRQDGESSGAYATRVAAADASLDAQARAMGQLLLSGIARQLSSEWKSKRLVIAAAGVLEYLPFAVVRAPDDTLLAAQHEIVTIPSASVLATLRRDMASRAQAPRPLAILADPVFAADDPRLGAQPSTTSPPTSDDVTSRAVEVVGSLYARNDWSRLRFSREEANAIASLTRSSDVLKATDFKASRATALSGALSGHRIVHFATHGVVDSDRPALSALILSLVDERGARQNGYLRLHDIYNMRLDADLVVLSACQTALGKEIKGEGLIGLTRAFFYAGAPRVVASLWQVNDLATAELMKKFYRGLLQQRLRPAAALRAAQIEMSRDPRWKSPYFWAGFVLQGEWR
jgi:CHAT domain-containing protein/Tfp pilus assembly protein PilF